MDNKFESLDERYFENIPILKRIDILFSHINDSGLKLTQKGNLPTKVIKEMALVTPNEVPEFIKRFVEFEFPKLSFLKKSLLEGKLVYIKKNTLFKSETGKFFESLSYKERYFFMLRIIFEQVDYENFFDEMSLRLFFPAVTFFHLHQKEFYDSEYLMEELLSMDEEVAHMYQALEQNEQAVRNLYVRFRFILLEMLLFEFGLVQKKMVDYRWVYGATSLIQQLEQFQTSFIRLVESESFARFRNMSDFTLKFFQFLSAHICERESIVQSEEEEELYLGLFSTLEYLYSCEDIATIQSILDLWHSELLHSLLKQDFPKIKHSIIAIEKEIKSCAKIHKDDLLHAEGHEAYKELEYIFKKLRKISKIRSKEKELIDRFLFHGLFFMLFLMGI